MKDGSGRPPRGRSEAALFPFHCWPVIAECASFAPFSPVLCRKEALLPPRDTYLPTMVPGVYTRVYALPPALFTRVIQACYKPEDPVVHIVLVVYTAGLRELHF